MTTQVTCRICSAHTSVECQEQDCPIRPGDPEPGTRAYAELHYPEDLEGEYDPDLKCVIDRRAGAGLYEE